MINKLKHARYMNLGTDFAFKFVFADRKNKALLIDLLNTIVDKKDRIVDIEYMHPEQMGLTEEDRKVIFDLFCMSEKEERYVVEMQLAKHDYFLERVLYYATFPIQKQAIKGEWNFELKPLYFIAIMNFVLPQNSSSNYVNHYALMNVCTHELLLDKLNFITVELPKFNKMESELKDNRDYWLYCFKNLPKRKEPPQGIEGTLFDKLVQLLEINNLNTEDMAEYVKSITEYSDVQLAMQCSRREGMEKGVEKGIATEKVLIAKKLLNSGMTIDFVIAITDLTSGQIQQLK
jgi:predicted transposase/invertase (TIGR01784 family)